MGRFVKFQSIIALAMGLFVFPSLGHALTCTWTGATSNAWATAGNWSGCGGLAPVAGSSLVFPLGAANLTTSNNIAANTSFASISITGTGYTLATNAIDLASGGTITANDSGASNTISIAITLLGNATITATNSNETLNISGIISDGGNNYRVTMPDASAGTVVLSGSNTFGGGLIIDNGTVQGKTSANAFGGTGTGTITVGDSTGGSYNATILGGSSNTFANPIVLASTTTGTLSIGNAGTLNPIFSGGVTGTNNLTLNNQSTGTITLSTASVNNTGSVTNVGSGSGTVTISSVIGTNVTAVIQNSGTSQLTLSGSNTFTGSGLTILQGTVTGSTSANALGGSGTGTVTIGNSAGGSNNATLVGASATTFPNPIVLASNTTGTLTIGMNVLSATFSGGITGNNNLTINNTTSVNNPLTFSTVSINNVGTITNVSTGVGVVAISSVIGNNVTGVIENSSTSQLNLSGVNTFTGSGLTILQGIVEGLVSSSAFGGSGTGTVTIGNSAGGADNATMEFGVGLTFANPVVLASNTTGTLSIVQASFPATFTGGVTGSNDLTVANSGTNPLTISTGSINNTGTVTNAGAGTFSVTINSIIGNNVTKVTQNTSTSKLILTGANTFAGSGLIILSGIVDGQTSASAFGAGTITLGDSTGGSSNATLESGGGLTIANPIALASTTTGTLLLTNDASSAAGVTFSGNITGTNNLVVNANNSGAYFITLSGASINNTGTITNSGTAAAAVTISAPIGSNVTAITQASNTSAITVSGAVTVNGSGTTFNDNASAGVQIFTLSGGVTGAGPVVFNNNSTIVGGITVSGASLNNTGTVTNTGTGTGSVAISAVIGTNVTGVTENSSTSQLTLSGANTFTGTGLTILSGLVEGLTSANAFGGSGTGTITLGDSTGGSNAATVEGGSTTTFANPIVLASTTTGTLTVAGIALFVSPTFSGGVTGNNNLTINMLENNIGVTLTLSTAIINNVGTVTNAGTGDGLVAISSVIGTNVTGVFENSSANSAMILSGNNTFTSGLTIDAGTVQGKTSANALGASISTPGAGTVTLGYNGGSSNASLLAATSLTFANPIVLSSNDTGILTVGNSNSSTNVSYTGGVTGSNNLNIVNESNNRTVTFSGGAINNAGTITDGSVLNGGGGFANITISAAVGSNVTGIIENATTAGAPTDAFTISGPITANGSGLTLTNSTSVVAQAVTLNITGGITGTGAVVINNNTPQANGIAISGTSVNNSSTVTNSSTGTGAVTISAIIGASVTGVTQNTSTSQLNLSGANTFGGGLTILSGVVYGSSSAKAFGGNGTGTIILGNSAGGSNNATVESGGSFTYANPIVLASTTTGTLTIEQDTSFTTIFSGGVTGSNNLIINNLGAGPSNTLTLSTATVNNTGSISNLSTGVGTVNVSSSIGANVTGVTENTSTSTLTLSSANTYTGPTTITSGTIIGGAANFLQNSGTISIASGTTLNLAGFSPGAGAGATSFSNSGLLKLTGDETVTNAPTNNIGSTVDYTATSGTRNTMNWNYANATFEINGAGGTFRLPANLTTINVLLAAGILSANGHDIALTGNWTNTGGTFTPGANAVTLNGSSAQTVTSGGQSFHTLIDTNASSGGVTFADAFSTVNFTDTTPGSILFFANALNNTISGVLNMAGTVSNLIKLETTNSATPNFIFNVSGGSASVSYLDVGNADASSNKIVCSPCIDLGDNNDGGGNNKWQFNTSNSSFSGMDF